jgi:glycosyltransferase involved in cell wall biosynthesis
VVIPTVRGGPYLREAVASVLGQTYGDFELIIVADGCEEDLSGLEALDPRIRVLTQPNRGESVARNVGIRASRADLIAFVDDDDRMGPDRLRLQVQAMAACPDATLSYSQFRIIDGSGAPGDDGWGRPVDYLGLLRGELGVLMPTTMMRRSRLQEVGTFDAGLKTGQDVDVILRLARCGPLAYVPTVLTEYRIHSTNASADAARAGEVLEEILAKHLAAAERAGDATRAAAARTGIRRVRALAGSGHITSARNAWREHHPATALRWGLRALTASPGVTLRDLIGNRRPVRAVAAAIGAVRSNRTNDTTHGAPT